MTGFVILVIYGIFLISLICYQISRKGIDSESIRTVILAGGRAKSSTLIFSVFAAWMWPTSVLGAVETYSMYGILGPISYVFAACLAFMFFVWVINMIQTKIEGGSYFLDLISQVHGDRKKMLYFIFAFIVPAYVLIEQAVGVAYVFQSLFGTNFKWIAFFSIIVAVVFVGITGMEGLLRSEKITGICILIAFVFITGYFVNTDTSAGVVKEINAHEEWFNTGVIAASVRYFITAVVIAFSQLVFDPGYYLKGRLAPSNRNMKMTFYAGGIVLWGGVSLVASVYLGVASYTQDTEVMQLFTGVGSWMFGAVMMLIGVSTISHYLMGWYGLFTEDLYTDYLRTEANEHQRIIFGRVLMVAGGIFCALIAISLENISLLTIDVFCAIFFAAPCGPVLHACVSTRKIQNCTSIIATVAGIGCGLLIWIFIPSRGEYNHFLGVVGSLSISIICSEIGARLKRFK